MITQRLGAEEGDTPVEQQPAAMQDFDPTYDRCGSFFAIRSHADIHFTVRIGLKAGIFQSGHHRPVIWPTSTTLAVWSGTGLNEAADAAVERSLEVDARAPGGARGVAGVARCHPSVKKSRNFNELAGKTIRQTQSRRRKSL